MTLRQPYRQRSMNPHPRVWGESDTALSYDCVTPMRAGDVGSCAPTPNSSLLTPNWTYTFSAKERDSETGLSYFGSRYYSADLSIWLSVDPMSDKYPSLSPYVYCADNPVKLVDPNGEAVIVPLILKGANNSSVTIETDLINKTFDVSKLGVDFGGNFTLQGDEILSAALDLAGIVDPSPICDGLNTYLQLKQGKKKDAFWSACGLCPYLGDLSKLGRVKKDIGVIKTGIDAIKTKSVISFVQRSGKDGVKITTTIPKGYRKIHSGNKSVVYTNGKYFISPDLDEHNGGVWKMAKKESDLWRRETRMGTYDANLKRVGD